MTNADLNYPPEKLSQLRVFMHLMAKGVLLSAAVVCSSCDPSSTYHHNVEHAQKRLDTVIQEIEKNVSPETIITCSREVIAGVPAEKYSKGTYWVPKSELPACWPSLGLDSMLVKVGANGTGQGGPCLTLILNVEEEEFVLFVYSQGVKPDTFLMESPYKKKWREGLYILYGVRQ